MLILDEYNLNIKYDALQLRKRINQPKLNMPILQRHYTILPALFGLLNFIVSFSPNILFHLVCSENVLKTMITNPVYGNQVEVIYDEIPNSNNKYPQTLPQGLEESDEGYTSVRSTPVQVRTLPDIKPENQVC